MEYTYDHLFTYRPDQLKLTNNENFELYASHLIYMRFGMGVIMDQKQHRMTYQPSLQKPTNSGDNIDTKNYSDEGEILFTI